MTIGKLVRILDKPLKGWYEKSWDSDNSDISAFVIFESDSESSGGPKMRGKENTLIMMRERMLMKRVMMMKRMIKE